MIESDFIASVRKKLTPDVYALKLNLPYTAGVPDCWYSGAKSDMWIEYKFLKQLPRTIDPRKLLSPLQAKWITDRAAENRKVAVVIGSSDGHIILPGLTWMTPLSRHAFHSQAVATRDVSTWIQAAVAKAHGQAQQQQS